MASVILSGGVLAAGHLGRVGTVEGFLQRQRECVQIGIKLGVTSLSQLLRELFPWSFGAVFTSTKPKEESTEEFLTWL